MRVIAEEASRVAEFWIVQDILKAASFNTDSKHVDGILTSQ